MMHVHGCIPENQPFNPQVILFDHEKNNQDFSIRHDPVLCNSYDHLHIKQILISQ